MRGRYRSQARKTVAVISVQYRAPAKAQKGRTGGERRETAEVAGPDAPGGGTERTEIGVELAVLTILHISSCYNT